MDQQIIMNVSMAFVTTMVGGGGFVRWWLERKDKLKSESNRLLNLETEQDVTKDELKEQKRKDELILQTLSAVSYSILATKLYHYNEEKGYADAQDRREIEILWAAYKAHGWNGDMNSRIENFRKLPYSPLKNTSLHMKEGKYETKIRQID